MNDIDKLSPLEFALTGESCKGPRPNTTIYFATLLSPSRVRRERLKELCGKPLFGRSLSCLIKGVESRCMPTVAAGHPIGLLVESNGT